MGILAAIFGTAFVVGLSGAMMPGPVLAVTIKGSVRAGFWFGPFLVLGHALLELPMVFGLGLGLGSLLIRSVVLGILSVVGGVALGIMAVGMLKEARTAALPTVNPIIATGNFSGSRVQAIWAGIASSLFNPFWPLWWSTIGLGMIGQARKLAATHGLAASLSLSSFYVGHISSDLLWYAFVSFMIATGRRLFTNKTYRALIALCAVFLLLLSGFFLYSGIAWFFSRGPLVQR